MRNDTVSHPNIIDPNGNLRYSGTFSSECRAARSDSAARSPCYVVLESRFCYWNCDRRDWRGSRICAGLTAGRGESGGLCSAIRKLEPTSIQWFPLSIRTGAMSNVPGGRPAFFRSVSSHGGAIFGGARRAQVALASRHQQFPPSFPPAKRSSSFRATTTAYVIGDGILFHIEENKFTFVGRAPTANWIQFHAETGRYNVTTRERRSIALTPEWEAGDSEALPLSNSRTESATSY